MGDNWIRLKYGKKEKGSDKKFTLLSRKNVDNEDGGKIRIRKISSAYQTEEVGDMDIFWGRGRKTEKNYDNTNPISHLSYFCCTVRTECMWEGLWKWQENYLCSWIIWAF